MDCTNDNIQINCRKRYRSSTRFSTKSKTIQHIHLWVAGKQYKQKDRGVLGIYSYHLYNQKRAIRHNKHAWKTKPRK